MKLSSQAIRILVLLQEKDGESTVDELEEEGFDQSMVNRASLELDEKDLANIEKAEGLSELRYEITEDGDEILDKEKTPEFNLLKKSEEQDKLFTSDEFWNKSVAIGQAQKKGWISIENGELKPTNEGLEVERDPTLQKLRDIEEDNTKKSQDYEELADRNLIRIEKIVPKKISLTNKGETTDPDEIEEDFNVEASVETPRTGKKHFYKDILDFAREKFVEMGFQEMRGDFIVPSLLNFDALYTAQDHPARDLHDTFFMENPANSDLSEYGEKVDHIKSTHEDGWTTGSTGWGYDWSREEASRNVLRTHTTAVSARRLHEIDINEEELPKKFFIIGRNFRNETVDRTHLPGFIQLDGIVVGEDLNYKNLKAYLSEFFEKMGYDEFRLIPSYYPYTEMSTEVQVYDEEEDEWLGMGGAGLFRPEVVKPLLGFEATVLAWGLGLGRIAMKAADIQDIRELYRNDIEILEDTPKWRPDTRGGK